MNEDRRLTAIATDDAHFRHGDYDAFGGFVEVKAESLDPEALLAALKAGAFYSSQGPRLLDIEIGRAEISVASSPVHSIALLTGSSRGLAQGRPAYHGGGVRSERSSARWPAPPGAAKWFRIVAIDASGRRAWTNPIWLDELGFG